MASTPTIIRNYEAENALKRKALDLATVEMENLGFSDPRLTGRCVEYDDIHRYDCQHTDLYIKFLKSLIGQKEIEKHGTLTQPNKNDWVNDCY